MSLRIVVVVFFQATLRNEEDDEENKRQKDHICAYIERRKTEVLELWINFACFSTFYFIFFLLLTGVVNEKDANFAVLFGSLKKKEFRKFLILDRQSSTPQIYINFNLYRNFKSNNSESERMKLKLKKKL
jgi:hypothetical protein